MLCSFQDFAPQCHVCFVCAQDLFSLLRDCDQRTLEVNLMMESTGQQRKHLILTFQFLVVSIASTHGPLSGNSVNMSSEMQLANFVLGQHMFPFSSVDVVPQQETVSSHSQNRWRTQMASSRGVYSFEVKEDTLPGTVVGKLETLFGSLTPITYSVQEDDGENLFLLSPLSGEFLLSRSLDFEAECLYILTVVVQQGDSQVSSVRVYFNVLNVNDNPPVFSQDAFSASLQEGTRFGECFLSLNVSDKDDGDIGKLKLKVLDGDEETMFFTNSAGSLCLNKELDRERQSSYNLTVTASDSAEPESLQLTSTAHVLVVVLDVNDNAPLFVSGKSVLIPEDAALHSVVMTVHAEDGDAGSNGEVLYYLNSTSSGMFSINTTSGEISLEETLDREQEDTLTITITAADRGSPSMATTMNLTVHVDDANDNDPEFSQSSYSLTVREDIPRGTSLFQVQAHDEDIGPNGQVRYTLTQASPFVVDAVRGTVTVMDKLDRERDSNYYLIITAVDQGNIPRSATAALSVTVLDINDFVPWFSPETLVLHVGENEDDPAQLQHELSALDEDLGVNSQLTYFLQSGNSDGLFSLTLNGTFQILHSLDRERESMYIITTVAVDSGLPPLTGTLTVHIIVDDVNDNHPEFTEEVYNTIVYEDSPPGTVFAMIMASDIDEGVNGEIRYFMDNPDVPFAIEETSGELLTTDVLDRETVAIYRLTVISSDKHPTQPLSSSVLVTVLVGDINDHWPKFVNSPYVAHVPTEMAPVKATDEDTEMNAELHYSLYGPSSDLFSIDPHSGTMFTSSALRRTEDVIVNIHVEDTGENPKFDTATVSIRFQNISDFPEMNVDVLSYSLSEDEPVGTLVALLSAVSVRAEPVSFHLASGNFEEVFHVEQLTGALTVENPLDYENKKEFTLLVEARDSGSPPFSSFAEIHVNISDVNDNFPQFTQAEYRCEIFENSPPSWVCDILAIDADSDGYGTVRYNITEGNSDDFFAIEPESGFLSTTASLDRETIPEFSLTVEASELENPLHKDRATVVIIVLDRNDNTPRFSRVFLTQVPEDAPIGHTIIQITSADDDTSPNAVINYSISDQMEDLPFRIEFTTGCITVERLLDREMQDYYVLKVNANDSAWSISTDVTIVVTDINDNRPVFTDPFYKAVLTETKDKEVFVMQVLATDADIRENSDILYVIEPPNEEFWVNATSGEIYTKQPLVLQKSTSLLAFEVRQFTVTAVDCGSNPLQSNATVTVRLEPYNHHPPLFLMHQPLVAIPYHMAVGTEMVQFTAIDVDVSNSSANILYALNGGNASDFFWIQVDSGKVKLKRSLTESIHLFLTLIVVAEDQGTPSLSSQTEITFEITGRNQYSPSFPEPEVTYSVPEDLPVGSVIGRVQAEDRDDGVNAAIVYCVQPESLLLPFSVGETSGLLTLIRELDFEKEVVHHLHIKAMDGGWDTKTGWLNVTVVVIDVNDNPPVFFSSEYLTSVTENSEIGTNVIHTKATDADSGPNARISYSLIAGHVDKFAIDSKNGTITTLDVFDYEREQIFDVTIKASNIVGLTLFTLAHVVIQILDINEFTPTFTKKEFNFSVFKNVPVGTVIGKVTATDDDQGSAGQVFYLMFGQKKNMGFKIHKLSGEIYTTSSLRKQGNSQIVVKVLAKNAGVITGMDIDETLVHIRVIDTNDAPVFTSARYLANVTEDSPVGTSVMTLSALDQDSILDWSHFFFSIESGNTNFSFVVDPLSGVVSVNSPLDRELWAVYNLTVTATDNGSPPATGTSNVIVTVGDANDSSPELTITEARVKENQPGGTIVARLNASDTDLPPNQGPFTYWLVNPSGAFSLTPDGVLFTTRPTDREQTSVYQVLLAVRDAGIPALSSTTVFHIRIVDENDNPSLPRNIFIEVKYFGSSFQGGMIGNVHPEDQDESDTFICGIKSGSLNMFMIPNGTCELWSSPFQGEATFNITIEATDQLHFPVNNSIYVKYKGFTNASIDSCILFYVSSSSMEEFLSNKYLRFVKALDSLFNLQASKTHVFGIKHIGSEILLLAAVKNYNGEYLSTEVASGVSAGHRKLLESQSDVMISHITSDPCLTSPCQNGATCKKNIYISQDVAALESLGVIFVSPQKEVFNCTCPAGFTGTLCEDDIDECEVKFCQNDGTCVNTAGSFYCHCQSGFSGSVCSIDVDECLKLKCENGGTCLPKDDRYYCHCAPGFEGEKCEQFIDHCRSTPCVQGKCINSQTGFSCQCPFGVSGVHCEEHSYGFEDLSFMEFPPLDRRTNLISLEFATVQSDSLLLYNPGGPSSREFFALEIIDGTIQLSYDLGSGPVRLHTNKQVADGHFHSVAARRIGNMGSLHVDNCTDVDNSGFCFSQSDGSSSERTLDVGGSNVTFGGLRTVEFILLPPAQIKTHDFVGCIRNIHVNGILLRAAMALATYNILDKCPRAVSPCQSDPCKNGGVCHDLWSDYLCECKSPFIGRKCAKESSEEVVLRFTGNDYIEYVIKEKFKRDFLLKQLLDDKKEGNDQNQTGINIKFKTRNNGVLISVMGQTGYIMLKIKDGRLVFLSEDAVSGHQSDFTLDSPVADGVWHVVSLFGKGQILFLALDGKPVGNITDQSVDLTPVHVEKIVLGAPLTLDSKLQQSGFTGCVQYLNVSGHTLPVSGSSAMADIWLSWTLMQSSCISPGVCLPSPCSEEDAARRVCLSGQCQNRWRCGPTVQNSSCICLHNVSGHACDICISAKDSQDQCSGAGSGHLWLIAVILPLISILVFLGMFVVLRKVRRNNAKCLSESLEQKTEPGTENAAFCFDDNRPLTNAASAEREGQNDSVRADQQSSELYCDACPSSAQPEPVSELEYYEISSISSAFHSDTASLRLSWHKHLYGTKCVNTDPRRCGDLKMLSAGFKKEVSGEERQQSPKKPRNMDTLNKLLLPMIDAVQTQHSPPCYMKRIPQPELPEPVQCLTFEEISKLNAPPEQTLSNQVLLSCTPMMDVSSDSDTDSTSTLSESEHGQVSVISTRKYGHQQSNLSTHSCRQPFPVSKSFKLSAAGQHEDDNTPSSMFKHWETIFNMHLPYSSYVPVFEDIARLPMEPSRSYDMQSDIEEII
ncbi:protocadherin Fat 4 isoform X2 [Paralichthys olivaceus]|uniref:protocadherin Fat 4 isoform X2 n=1 Tax=Paralichthys olivaceus TaxID=8255 RepID=UPI0037536D80